MAINRKIISEIVHFGKIEFIMNKHYDVQIIGHKINIYIHKKLFSEKKVY